VPEGLAAEREGLLEGLVLVEEEGEEVGGEEELLGVEALAALEELDEADEQLFFVHLRVLEVEKVHADLASPCLTCLVSRLTPAMYFLLRKCSGFSSSTITFTIL
jgi:hypothetical protein